MCLICSDLGKGLITVKDARRNAAELADSITIQHAVELMELIESVEESDEEE